MEHIWSNIDRLALNLVCPTAVISNAANHRANIASGHADRLAIIERLDRGKELGVLLTYVGKLDHQPASLLGSSVLPAAFEGLPCRRYGQIDVFLGGFRNGADDLLVGGVDDFESLLVDSFNPFIIDESVTRCIRYNPSRRKAELSLTIPWAVCKCQ
jgi:hypothetical protein